MKNHRHPSYSDYRRFGHGRWGAFVLSVPAGRWYGSAVIVGILVGILLGLR